MAAAATSRPLGRGSFWRRHRRVITAALAVLVAAAFVRYALPHIASLGPTLRRLRHGHVAWLAVGVALEACSLFGEVALFRGVFARPGNGIGWTTSAEITLAGAAATKLVAAAGAWHDRLLRGLPGEGLACHARGARVQNDCLLASNPSGSGGIHAPAPDRRDIPVGGAINGAPAPSVRRRVSAHSTQAPPRDRG